MKQLNAEQQRLVNDYHFLIKTYAKRKHINIFDSSNSDMHNFGEDWYGVLSIGLCKAALNYNKELGAFVPYAFRAMDFAVAQAKRNYIRHNPKILFSSEELICEMSKGNKNDEKLISHLYNKFNLIDNGKTGEIEIRLILEKSYQKMGQWGEICRRILEYQATFSDIARELGISRQAVWQKYHRSFLPYLQSQIKGDIKC